MKNYKILVIPSDNSGCGKFRSVDPHLALMKLDSEHFDIDIKSPMEVFAHSHEFPTFLEPYDLIHIHKQMDGDGVFIQMCLYLGKKVVVDIDDHYDLGLFHPMSRTAKEEHWADKIVTHLRYATCVTTTTELFKKTLLKHNKNVVVLPNAVNPDEPQFKPVDNPSSKLRVGIICGSSHMEDLKLLQGMISQFSKEELDRLQFVLCGFDLRGNNITIRPDGTKTLRPLLPTETCWFHYERIMTDDYKITSPQYTQFLHAFIPNAEYPLVSQESYRRCWTKSIDTYATHYNNIDVLLAPLHDNEFNKSKSQLKVIEAGFFHKAIIASNIGPYTIDLKHAVDRNNNILKDGNALLVDSNKNRKNWSKYIKLLLNDRNLLHTLQENLYQTVKDKYNWLTVAEERRKLYLKLLED